MTNKKAKRKKGGGGDRCGGRTCRRRLFPDRGPRILSFSRNKVVVPTAVPRGIWWALLALLV